MVKLPSILVTPVVRCILSILCRIDAAEMRKIPKSGPLIIAMNHVNFLEVPLVFAWLWPRDAVGLVKRETWKNPLLGLIADSWNAIPIDREATDLGAMRSSLEVLGRGGILLLAPEGTRSGHGRLQKGHGGAIQLALHSGAPIMPLAHSGGEIFWKNFKSLRRTPFRVRVGKPFRLVPPSGSHSVSRSVREAMTDEVMCRIAALLPASQRGAYPHPESAPMEFIEYLRLGV